MISAMGVAIFLENLVYATLGAHFYSYPEVLGRSIVRLGGASIGILDLFALAFSSVAIAGAPLLPPQYERAAWPYGVVPST